MSYRYAVTGDHMRLVYSRHRTRSAAERACRALARRWGWSHPGAEPRGGGAAVMSDMAATTTSVVRPQVVDHLGRVSPAIMLKDVVGGSCTPRGVQECLAIAAQYGRLREYNEIVVWAISRGVTHGPADLAGRRSRFRLCLMDG